MHHVNKALWFIETRLDGELSLDDIASVVGVSRFHLSRIFATAIGQSALRYARGRRLTEAARKLAAGAPDILSVAVEAGYGSHEAFTRAFRDLFGVTPENLRARASLTDLKLMEPIRMSDDKAVAQLDPPRFERSPTLLIAGIGQRYECGGQSGPAGIPLQWQRLAPHFGHIPCAIGEVAYGVMFSFDEEGSFNYIAGVPVERFADLPSEFETVRVPERAYAVFTHKGHVSAIPASMNAVWSKWAPETGHRPVDAPFFERYDERFNPVTGEGEVEIWVPVEG